MTKITPIVPDTSEQVRAKIDALAAVVRAKKAERTDLQRAIPRILAENIGSDLAAVKERRRVAELTAELNDLHQAERHLLEKLQEARQREFDVRWSRDREVCQRHGDALVAAMQKVEEKAREFMTVILQAKDADKALCDSLRVTDGGFSPRSHSASLESRIAVWLYARSDALTRFGKPTFESPHELIQSGRADLVQYAKDYVFTAVRRMDSPPLLAAEESSPPEAA